MLAYVGSSFERKTACLVGKNKFLWHNDQMNSESPKESQSQRFADAARAAECDEDEARWQGRLKRVVKHKPVPEKPTAE